MSIYLLAKITVKQDHAATVESALKALIVPTRKESGCEQYELLQDSSNSNIFYMNEIWESEAHLNTHMESAHFQAFMKNNEIVIESLEPIMLNYLA